MTQQGTLDSTTTLPLPLEDRNDAVTDGEQLYYGLTLVAWLKIAVVSVLMIATFRFNLYRLWLKTNPFTGELNWRHSVVVPLVGLYYLYVNRDELLKARTYVAWSGLPILIFGILLFGYGIWPGQNDFIKDFGMVISLFGVVTLLCGWQVMKIAWFPIAFLVCAIPWPQLAYSYIASPLQHLAASVAVGVLRFTGVDAQNQGTKILMFGPKGWRALNVAEACAGLRSLMTFISVGAAVAFLSVRPLWQKFLITLSAIPIAIFCNVMRVSGQGLLHRYVSEDWSEGFAHQFAGTVMLIPGFLFIVLVCWILDRIFIEVADDGPRKQRSTMVPAGAAPAAADWKLPKPPTAPSGAIARTVAAPAAAKPAAPKAAATVMPPRPTLAPKPAPGAAPRTPAAAAKPAGPAPATPQAPQARPPVQQKPVAPKPPVAGAQPVPPSRPAVAKPQAARPQQKQPLPPPPQQQKPTQPKPPEGA